MPLARANGINLHYDVTGSGEPLLLIPGLGANLLGWAHPDTGPCAALSGDRLRQPQCRPLGCPARPLLDSAAVAQHTASSTSWLSR
jgi:pimeloyl-ACP methyl ester carboxylesterase